MVVKKKDVARNNEDGMIDSPELSRVRSAIQILNREEGDTVAATKKAAVKEATEAPKKSKKAEASDEDDRVTLSALCEKLDIQPATARRKLRAAEGIDRGDGRWAWKKGSKELAAVEAVLKAE